MQTAVYCHCYGKMDRRVLFVVFIMISSTNGGIPGTFFWKPRLGIELVQRSEGGKKFSHPPTQENIRKGVVVIVDAYHAGMTLLGLAASARDASPPIRADSLSPLRAAFYVNSYQWAVRHLSLLQYWLAGNARYVDTHKVWNRRFHYRDLEVPDWMTYFLPHVPKEEWQKYKEDAKKFREYAEFAFNKHNRYPNKQFTNFLSCEESSEESNSASLP